MTESNITYSIKEIRKKIYSMILPITVESILQMTAGLVSMSLIGRIPGNDITSVSAVTEVSAISISSRITQMIWALFKGITTGASVFAAQDYGAKNTKKLKSVIQ